MDARRSFTQPRQSVFSAGGSVVPLNEGPANHLSYLHATVQMVARCSSTLGEIADEQKTEGIHDLDRMMRIIENQRLFVLIDEPQLKAAQNQLEDEIGPQLNTLLERAEKAIEISAIKSSQAAAVAKASAAASKRGDARRLQILQARREKAERELDEVEAEMRKMEAELMKG
ncbi:unnamed protein product [Rhizoctonia solani]|uniref:DASH complex subunit SPC19 n=1 Tax=Rhizoctonia solani TaxID=456999 RepID=A0A8H3AU64_9AGAM|nr:unnamed protein product [Rhizoctonia solani]